MKFIFLLFYRTNNGNIFEIIPTLKCYYFSILIKNYSFDSMYLYRIYTHMYYIYYFGIRTSDIRPNNNLFFNYQGVDKLRESERSNERINIRNTRDLVFAFDVFGT